MVSPIFYRNVYGGLSSIDREILDLARVYKVSTYKKIRYIYFSRIETSIRAACEVGLGFCWKSGIAAEVFMKVLGCIFESLEL